MKCAYIERRIACDECGYPSGEALFTSEEEYLKGGYGEPIRTTCDLCGGKLSHKEMVHPAWLSTDLHICAEKTWKYVCSNCWEKVVESWIKDNNAKEYRKAVDSWQKIPDRPEITE